VIFVQHDPQTKRVNTVISSFAGVKKIYKKYVDVRIPADMPMEIRTVDKNGQLYKVYKDELERKESELWTPDQGPVSVN
jgi:hypothetical protein